MLSRTVTSKKHTDYQDRLNSATVLREEIILVNSYVFCVFYVWRNLHNHVY